MALKPVRTTKFKKDVKRMLSRGKDGEKLADIIKKLVNEDPLNPSHKPHPLAGEFKGSVDCHIEPDWLLICRIEGQHIFFERTGTHSDLFQ